MDLDKYELSEWEKSILTDFDIDDCLEDIVYLVHSPMINEFLINLADALLSFDKRNEG